MERFDTQVIIVGGGPVGLTMALSLQHLGVDFVIVERGDGLITHPRVGTVGVRSMEIYRKLGVSEQFYKSGWPEEHPLDVTWTTGLGGHEILRLKRGSYAQNGANPLSPETEAVCPHHWLCPGLQSHLAEYPEGPFLLNTKMVGFTQGESGVEVQVEHERTGEKQAIFAQYIVACDGGKSKVRAACDIQFEQYHPSTIFENVLFEAPYLHELLGESNSLIHFMVSPNGLRYPLRSMDGKSLFRLTVKPREDEVIDPLAMVKQAINYDTPIYIRSSIRWELSHRVADKYRDRRVFLAGDAPHVISPSGGYGMNTGIADADNLAWKLAAVLNRNADNAILDTYEQERRPVALKSLEESKGNLMRTLKRDVPHQIDQDTEAGKQCRIAFAQLLKHQQAEREFNAPDVHLGSCYGSTIIAKQTCHSESGDWSTLAMTGYRAPHILLNNGASILDLFGQGFVLLSTSSEIQQMTTMRLTGLPITVIRLEEEGVQRVYQQPFTLIRPDGYVAWQGRELNADVLNTFHQCCGTGSKHTMKQEIPAEID